METKYLESTEKLINFINKSPTAFQAVDTVSEMLEAEGFVKLEEYDVWSLEAGGKYYVTRNGSSVLAFTLPVMLDSFMIAASHSDSPTFKLKSKCEQEAFGTYVKLNVERYGGMIMSCWLDRPLSVAGRVTVNQNGVFSTKSVVIDKDLCLIPNVAIHFNRAINDGFKYDAAVDMMPLYSDMDGKGKLINTVAEYAGVSPEEIVGTDLFLYDRTPATIWGEGDCFFSSPRIDNLMCAYTTLSGFINSENSSSVCKVYACFDNEETGSSTKQGAASAFMHDTLERICAYYSKDLRCALASSFMVSADNGHAKHPNHPEFSDADNSPKMNGGVVIKSNASQKYTTDGLSSAIFAEICKRAGVPTQLFANKSNIGGGSTLGSISNTVVPLNTVDIGLAQLAMHSCYETAGCADTLYMETAMKQFYESKIQIDKNGNYLRLT